MTVYFGSAALLWAVDSPHLAIVMVHLNVLESVLALKIKALNDSVAKAVQQLQSTQLQFALLVRLWASVWACDGSCAGFSPSTSLRVSRRCVQDRKLSRDVCWHGRLVDMTSGFADVAVHVCSQWRRM